MTALGTRCWSAPSEGGGGSYFALDVTSPDGFTSETTVASKVLWEITAATTGFSDLGATFSNPAIVRMHNGEWAAVFGNGFDSTSGKAVLYIVDIETGALLQSFDTKVGPDAVGPNGLATPAPVDVDGDWIVDYIYAGDMKGNMWKFDVTSSDPASWGTAFGSAASPLPLFKAQDGAGIAQPITTGPQIGRHPDGKGGRMLYFGTGKYFETGDGDPVGATTQSFYGIWDKFDGTHGASRTDLLTQKVLDETTQNGFELRITSNYSIDYTSQQGWYMDLPTQGERQVSDSVLDSGRIIFATLYPSTHPCDFGGTSWLMELDPRDGSRLGEAAFDLNGDGIFTDLDLIKGYDEDGDGVPDIGDPIPPTGKKAKVGIISTPTIIGAGAKKYKYTSGSKNAQIEVTVESNPGAGGRQSWRQLQ